MASGGSSSQTQTSTSRPPAYSAAGFRKAAEDALALYNSGQGNQVYQGDRVADLSGQSNNAINGLNDVANQYRNNSYLNGIINNPTSSSQNLSGIADKNFIGNNPYFKENLQNTLNDVANSVNSQFSGAGRYGSGAHSGVLANKLGEVAANQFSQQYNRDVANNLAANQQIDQANMNQLAGANSYYNGQSAADLNLLQGGKYLDQNNQAKLTAEQEKWQEAVDNPHNRILRLLSELQAASNGYGTTTTVGESKQKGGFLQSLGGILGGLSGLGGSIFRG